MFTYPLLKVLHIFAAMVFLGTGLGSAWYRLRSDFSDDLHAIAWCQREIVLADWLFTLPAGIMLPVTAIGLIHTMQIPWTTPWIMWGFCGYLLSGVFWVPAVWLQIMMRQLAKEAVANGTPLPPEFRLYARIWAGLGIPSFLAAFGTVWIMVAKHLAFGG